MPSATPSRIVVSVAFALASLPAALAVVEGPVDPLTGLPRYNYSGYLPNKSIALVATAFFSILFVVLLCRWFQYRFSVMLYLVSSHLLGSRSDPPPGGWASQGPIQLAREVLSVDLLSSFFSPVPPIDLRMPRLRGWNGNQVPNSRRSLRESPIPSPFIVFLRACRARGDARSFFASFPVSWALYRLHSARPYLPCLFHPRRLRKSIVHFSSGLSQTGHLPDASKLTPLASLLLEIRCSSVESSRLLKWRSTFSCQFPSPPMSRGLPSILLPFS